jgi:CheY-like chemotaxis protein
MTSLRQILLVEDSERDAELTLDALAENKLANEVVHARDGAEALDYFFRKGKFTGRPNELPLLVLLDLKLPKVDGLEVLRRIKMDPELRMVPVVMVTSSREERDLVESYKLGVNAYVVKPVGFEEFSDAVRKLSVFWAVVNEPPPGSAARKN